MTTTCCNSVSIDSPSYEKDNTTNQKQKDQDAYYASDYWSNISYNNKDRDVITIATKFNKISKKPCKYTETC